MSEHRWGQVTEAAVNMIRDGATFFDGRVYRRRVSAQPMVDIQGMLGGRLPAADVFGDDDSPLSETDQNDTWRDQVSSLSVDMYLVDPQGGADPELDRKASEARADVDAVILAGDRRLGLDFVVAVYPGAFQPLQLERHSDLPLLIYRLGYLVHYRVPFDDPTGGV